MFTPLSFTSPPPSSLPTSSSSCRDTMCPLSWQVSGCPCTSLAVSVRVSGWVGWLLMSIRRYGSHVLLTSQRSSEHRKKPTLPLLLHHLHRHVDRSLLCRQFPRIDRPSILARLLRESLSSQRRCFDRGRLRYVRRTLRIHVLGGIHVLWTCVSFPSPLLHKPHTDFLLVASDLSWAVTPS